MNRNLLQLLLGMLSLAFCLSSQAQGFQKKLSPDKMMGITTLYQNTDGTFLTTGINLAGGETRIMKLDANGNILWKADHDSIYSFTHSVITQDGGYYILGIGIHDSANHQNRVVLKTDANGQKIWLKRVHAFQNKPGQGLLGNLAIDTTDNGGFVFTMNPHSYNNVDTVHSLLIKRLDGNGNILWEKVYYDSTKFYSTSLTNSKDGGFLVGLGNAGSKKFFKIDGVGNFLWDYELPNATVIPQIARDGNILAVGSSNNFGAGVSLIAKVDQNGNDLWLQQYPLLPDSASSFGAIEMGGDTIAALCSYRDNQSPSGFEFGLAKFDTLGNLFAYYKINAANLGFKLRKLPISFKAFTKTIDGGFAFGGFIENTVPTTNMHTAYLIKVDAEGKSYSSNVSGNTYRDDDVNCQRSPTETFLKGTILSFVSAGDTFYTMTGDSGYYALGLNTGLYNISTIPLSPYWEAAACNTSQLDLPMGSDTSVLFGFNALVDFPYITIDGQTRQRICAANTYTFQYCNTGTKPFYGTLEVEFDSIMQIDSASTPWLSQSGNKVVFLDTSGLGISDCKTIKVYYTLPCDPILNGRTFCINTHAYSDTVINASPLWDQSNLKMSVAYNAAEDSVEFTLKNLGNGNMNTPQEMIVIEDNVILLKDFVLLNSGLEYKIKQKANGATFRATIPQTAFNPYSEFTTAAIEAAGATAPGTFSVGFLNQFPVNGSYAFDHTFCSPVLNSYDPNRKTVSPEGAGANHIISNKTALEYTLEFQNTGNDTAYVVRLVDTLADYLNPASIRPGASSHPFEFRFLSHNVIEFLFENINLPDSGSNQAASNGFVRFKIQQMPNNTNGTVINNNVSIYFDFNPPIVTNTATVRIGELTFVGIESLYAEKALQINAYPNPFSQEATINVEGEQFENMQLTIYDVTGKMVQQQYVGNTNRFIINRNGLAAGNFIFEIKANGKAIGRGRMIAE